MAVILLFMAALAILGGWWLSRQGLSGKPWLEVGAEPGGAAPSPLPTAKVGLGAFMAVAGSMFSLLASAYSMRMGVADWRALPLPNVLWISTALLILSCVAMQATAGAARRGQLDEVRSGLLAAGVSAIAFLSVQLMAWRELADAGYFNVTNPASAFFYLVTAVHGLHVLGGLAALGRTAVRAFDLSEASPSDAAARLRLGVELCTLYWHFLLAVWLVLLAFLTPWAGEFVAICRGLLS